MVITAVQFSLMQMAVMTARWNIGALIKSLEEATVPKFGASKVEKANKLCEIK